MKTGESLILEKDSSKNPKELEMLKKYIKPKNAKELENYALVNSHKLKVKKILGEIL